METKIKMIRSRMQNAGQMQVRVVFMEGSFRRLEKWRQIHSTVPVPDDARGGLMLYIIILSEEKRKLNSTSHS